MNCPLDLDDKQACCSNEVAMTDQREGPLCGWQGCLVPSLLVFDVKQDKNSRPVLSCLLAEGRMNSASILKLAELCSSLVFVFVVVCVCVCVYCFIGILWQIVYIALIH